MGMTGEGIRIEGVGKSYGDLRVLEGIDASIQKGSVVAFLGPNGCGKTTLLKIVSRNLDPDRGIVFLDGKNIVEMRPVELSKKNGQRPPDAPVLLPVLGTRRSPDRPRAVYRGFLDAFRKGHGNIYGSPEDSGNPSPGRKTLYRH
jgi:hypothetical protein